MSDSASSAPATAPAVAPAPEASAAPAVGAAAPPAPPPPLRIALAYIAAAIVIGLTQGLAQSFVTTNIAQIAGELGVTTTQATWLSVAFAAPRASMPIC